jgi:hypothetical protein
MSYGVGSFTLEVGLFRGRDKGRARAALAVCLP